MEEKTVKVLMAATEKHWKGVLLSYNDTNAARRAFTEGTLQWDRDDDFHKYAMSLGIWPEVEQALRKAPEPTPERLQKLINSVPEISYYVRKQLPDLIKAFPHPPGGAPKKLDEKQKARAVQLVGILMGRGDSYSEALQHVAERFGVSTKTIQRAWQEAHPSQRKRRGLKE